VNAEVFKDNLGALAIASFENINNKYWHFIAYETRLSSNTPKTYSKSYCGPLQKRPHSDKEKCSD